MNGSKTHFFVCIIHLCSVHWLSLNVLLVLKLIQIKTLVSFRTGPNLLDLVDVNKYTLGRINELLGENVATEMKTVFDKLQQLRSSISAQNLDGLSMSKLRSLLSASYSSDSGAKSNMISRILSRTEQGKHTSILGKNI